MLHLHRMVIAMSRNNEDFPAIDVDEERARSLSAALQLAENSAITRVTLDKRRRKRVIEYLAAGLTISQAAQRIGMTPTTIHRARRESPEFDDAVIAAIEIGTDPVVERFVAIAMHGNPESMATIRAGEVVLKGRNAAYRDRGGSVRMEKRDPDGTTYRISASANGVPD